jgi:hypothetical protein
VELAMRQKKNARRAGRSSARSQFSLMPFGDALERVIDQP